MAKRGSEVCELIMKVSYFRFRPNMGNGKGKCRVGECAHVANTEYIRTPTRISFPFFESISNAGEDVSLHDNPFILHMGVGDLLN